MGFVSHCIGLAVMLCMTAAETAFRNSCRYIPGDEGWPAPYDWRALNDTVEGRLIVTVPQASVCHTSPYSNYNETACESLKSGWSLAQTLYVAPSNTSSA
jgi:hypothetical protein